MQGPIDDPFTRVQYLDVSLPANTQFKHALANGLQAFLYVFEGDAMLANTALPQHTFAVLSEGDQVELVAGTNGARFILVAGRPLGEPIVQYGPFVMNSNDEIHQAMEDYRDGRLVQKKAAFMTD